MAASLGIKASNIKVVSVYQGSVIVDSQIIDDQSSTIAKSGGIEAVQSLMTEKLSSNSIDLGAPILNVNI